MRTTRTHYFVNPRLQFTLIFGANVLALISVALIYTLNAWAQSQVQSYAFSLNLPASHPFSEFVAQREAGYARMCLVLGVVQFVIFNLVAVLLSHRIAGPLYRLERHLEAVGEGGEPADVKFRKGDIYVQLGDACNKVMARLRALRSGAG